RRVRASGPRAIRGWPTRSSGTQAHLRPNGTSTSSHRSRAHGRSATCGSGWRHAGDAGRPVGAAARRVRGRRGPPPPRPPPAPAPAGGDPPPRLPAALARPPIAGLVVLTWTSARRLLPAAAASLVLFGLAALLTEPSVHLAVAALAFGASALLCAQVWRAPAA